MDNENKIFVKELLDYNNLHQLKSSHFNKKKEIENFIKDRYIYFENIVNILNQYTDLDVLSRIIINYIFGYLKKRAQTQKSYISIIQQMKEKHNKLEDEIYNRIYSRFSELPNLRWVVTKPVDNTCKWELIHLDNYDTNKCGHKHKCNQCYISLEKTHKYVRTWMIICEAEYMCVYSYEYWRYYYIMSLKWKKSYNKFQIKLSNWFPLIDNSDLSDCIIFYSPDKIY